MRDSVFLRDILVSGRNHAAKVDASEDIMRLAQDPLLLHEHLQSRERETPFAPAAVSDGRLESCLETLGERILDHRAAEAMDPAVNRYALDDRLFEPSLHPEAFAITPEDRKAAIDLVSPLKPDDESTIPPMLVGGILIVLGLVLLAAFAFDLLAADLLP